MLFGAAVGIEIFGIKENSAHSGIIPALNIDLPVSDHGAFRNIQAVSLHQRKQRVRGGLQRKTVLGGNKIGEKRPEPILLQLFSRGQAPMGVQVVPDPGSMQRLQAFCRSFIKRKGRNGVMKALKPFRQFFLWKAAAINAQCVRDQNLRFPKQVLCPMAGAGNRSAAFASWHEESADSCHTGFRQNPRKDACISFFFLCLVVVRLGLQFADQRGFHPMVADFFHLNFQAR